MAEFDILPVFTDAYLADTRHFTAAQHGAYFLLLMTAWRTKENGLPDDDDLLASWASMDKRTWLKNKKTILQKWILVDGLLHQKRLDDERKRAKYVRDRQVQGGLSSALKRQKINSRHLPSEHGAVHQPPSPSPSPELEIVGKDPFRDGVLFEEFWNLYPLKSSKADSKRAYTEAISNGVSHERIIEGVKLYAESVRGTAPRFIKDPPNWIRGEKWNEKPVDRSEKTKPANGRTAYSDTIKSATVAALDNLRENEKIRAQSN